MRAVFCLTCILAAFVGRDTLAFVPNKEVTIASRLVNEKVRIQPLSQVGNVGFSFRKTTKVASAQFPTKIAMASGVEEDDRSMDNFQINPLFAALWAGFFLFGVVQTAGEGVGAGTPSGDLIQIYAANPAKPDLNELFVTVFNLLGLAPLAAASLIMPSAKFQKLSATPFLFASAAFGYGALGPYMATRAPVTNVNQSDLGWFTRNVLENKLFSGALVLLGASIYAPLVGPMVADAQSVLNGFGDLTSQAAIALVSSCDLAIITLTLSILVAEDMETRGIEDKNTITAVSASTLLLPIVGAILYCAVRPSLSEGE